MKLNVLTNRKIGNSVGISASKVGNGTQLVGSHQAVGNPNPDHETLKSAPHAALATGHACSVTLGVNAPPSKISANPFGRDRVEAAASKAADFV